MRFLGTLMSSTGGVVYVEFLVAFVPMWVFFLCLIQLSFLAQASLLVRHAADSAARSAAVVLPDDPANYGGEPERQVHEGRIDGASIGPLFQTFAATLRSGEAHFSTDGFAAQRLAEGFRTLGLQTDRNLFGSRSNAISVAAHVPLMPLSPMDFFDSDASIANSLASEGSIRKAVAYNPLAVEVSYPGSSGNRVQTEEVTVRISYAYRCSIPIARNILCHDSLTGAPGGALAQLFIGGRYKQIVRESTFLIQDAPYDYQEEQ